MIKRKKNSYTNKRVKKKKNLTEKPGQTVWPTQESPVIAALHVCRVSYLCKHPGLQFLTGPHFKKDFD